jgi:nucleobase:cation symporter-1, NCS1 family
MVPFFSTGLYSGPIADAADGADYSLFIGLPVSGILYYIFSRSIDVAAETEVARRQADDLEKEAVRHARPETE